MDGRFTARKGRLLYWGDWGLFYMPDIWGLGGELIIRKSGGFHSSLRILCFFARFDVTFYLDHGTEDFADLEGDHASTGQEVYSERPGRQDQKDA